LAGVDLNRRYLKPNPALHPGVYAIKTMVQQMQQSYRIALYCDIHGHSRYTVVGYYAILYQTLY
jgi:hypothetical protein